MNSKYKKINFHVNTYFALFFILFTLGTLAVTAFAAPTPSQAPVLLSPKNGSFTSVTPTFIWSNIGKAKYYRIQITLKSDSTFSSPIINTLTNNTSFTTSIALTDNSYQWRVRGENSSGAGLYSNVFIFIVGPSDIQPPTVPTNLTATGISSNQIDLSWIESTDNFAVAGYKVYREGNQIAMTTSAIYSDTGLTANTSYSYTVSAFDVAGNISTQSMSANTTTQSAECNYPAQILDLTNWKETLPIGSSGSPTEIKQPALMTYFNDPYFTNSGCTGVQFRAPVNGVSTSNSSYPRSELREMANNGTTNASWATDSGIHTMFIDQMITSVPITKRHIVVGQVHNSSDDVIAIRLEYPKLFIDINGITGPTLDANYTLGTRFTVKFVASNGQISVYYNGSINPAYTLNKIGSGNYFKVGAYTQSNCLKELSGDCVNTNYGEMIIYNVWVTHS